MVFVDPISTSEIQQVSTKVTLMTKVVLPALATLVPAAAAATFKWLENHGGRRRSSELTERIATLSKSIAELPPIQLSATTLPSPQAAMTAELESAIRELTALQAKAGRHLANSLATTTGKVRSALLLYWPKGFVAWMLHLCFFGWLMLIALFVIGISLPEEEAGTGGLAHAPGHFSSMSEFVIACFIMGIPPLIFRYFAAWIHRRQCAQAAAGGLPVCPDPVTGSPQASKVAAIS
jgi:hypothetical protein